MMGPSYRPSAGGGTSPSDPAQDAAIAALQAAATANVIYGYWTGAVSGLTMDYVITQESPFGITFAANTDSGPRFPDSYYPVFFPVVGMTLAAFCEAYNAALVGNPYAAVFTRLDLDPEGRLRIFIKDTSITSVGLFMYPGALGAELGLDGTFAASADLGGVYPAIRNVEDRVEAVETFFGAVTGGVSLTPETEIPLIGTTTPVINYILSGDAQSFDVSSGATVAETLNYMKTAFTLGHPGLFGTPYLNADGRFVVPVKDPRIDMAYFTQASGDTLALLGLDSAVFTQAVPLADIPAIIAALEARIVVLESA